MIARFHHRMLATPVQANRAVAVLSKMMSLAIKRGDRPDRTNPAIGIDKFGEISRERVLSDTENSAFWTGADRLGFPFGPLFKLLLVTGQRRNEVAGMPWTELDLDNAIWTIAPARAKNKRQHEVYLSPLAMGLLNISHASDYVFSVGKTPPSGFSKAKSRLDGAMKETLVEAFAAWRLHDLRRTAASGMAGLGIRAEIIEKTLNHMSGINSGLVRIYQRHEHHEARKQALNAWSARLEELVTSDTN
jgi:integrase